MSDLISRQAAIKDAESWVAVDEYEKHLQKKVVEWLKELPSAQPEITHEQAVEYLQSKGWMQNHDLQMMLDGVHRFTAQPEPCEDAVSRQAAIDGLNDAVHEHNITDFDAVATILALPSVTPKRRTGKWILDRSGAYCCSKCMEPCAEYVMMKPRDKFCKMCGAKMEVTT